MLFVATVLVGGYVVLDPDRYKPWLDLEFEAPATDAELIAAFEEVVFLNAARGAPESHVRRWDEPLLVAARGTRAYDEALANAVVLMGLITGLEAQAVRAETGAERVVVHFGRATDLLVPGNAEGTLARTLHETAGRRGSWTAQERGGRGGFVVFITTDEGDTFAQASTAHELLHVLGFAGHASSLASVMNIGSRREEWLTVNDLILLRTLYDPRIARAMQADAALQAAREVIPELSSAVRARGAIAALVQR